MKEFNLKQALAGEPVTLRDGFKAFVIGRIPEGFKNALGGENASPLRGFSIKEGNVIAHPSLSWGTEGNYLNEDTSGYDIIGMWEEPELTPEQVLKTAYEKDLLVSCDGNPDLPLRVIAQTKDGEFVMQPENPTVQPWIANLTMEWFFVGNAEPEFDTASINLPKPFTPNFGESFYYVCGGKVENLILNIDNYDEELIDSGNCFHTEEDAQKWLDFMKSMLE